MLIHIYNGKSPNEFVENFKFVLDSYRREQVQGELVYEELQERVQAIMD
jgi:hypothetical protein